MLRENHEGHIGRHALYCGLTLSLDDRTDGRDPA